MVILGALAHLGFKMCNMGVILLFSAQVKVGIMKVVPAKQRYGVK